MQHSLDNVKFRFRTVAVAIAAGGTLIINQQPSSIRAIAAQHPPLQLAATPAESLHLTYPPRSHRTSASQIFFIGSAPPAGDVLINNQAVRRSPAGHFAPSLPLQLGENRFTLRHGNQEIQVVVTRVSGQPEPPRGTTFGKDSLSPATNIARLPEEPLCFSAIAPPNAAVSVRLGNQTLPLAPQPSLIQLPPNSAVLNAQNQPAQVAATPYQGCATADVAGNLGQPTYELNLNGETVSQTAPGAVTILSPVGLEVVEVTAEAGVARTGPSTTYSRLTPLPQGTRAAVTGREGEWLRLDYGAWIKKSETRVIPGAVPPSATIRSVLSRQLEEATEVRFPLTVPVPLAIAQGDDTFTLTLYNVTAQTDTIALNDDPLIRRLDWQQLAPGTVEYTFHLKTQQQWGYDVRYEGTSLILSLRHPPQVSEGGALPLQGVPILLDPGHGGNESGAAGPNGVLEKEINLVISKLLQQELEQRGATVYMTRETDIDVSLQDRMAQIADIQPAIALSVHYNALPDGGDAENTQGIGMFWYNAQAHSLAVFLHNYLVENLDRPSYGVFWNNLALTRPHAAPAVLMELGFMINPWEFEWMTDVREQERLADVLADGIVAWLQQTHSQ
ncbi:MAG: N-acetylmuramoyl-L-alanine amidase [Cyanobacteriota bacterium]|nr:N-acetylmuramoyl-L-alanine amidase [Cyanobacteriota bacterium]